MDNQYITVLTTVIVITVNTVIMMALQIAGWTDLEYISEEFDSDTGKFQYTMFAAIDSNDVVYYGELAVRKTEISFQQIMAALKPIPDSEIFPKWPMPGEPGAIHLTRAPPVLSTNCRVFVKRPNLSRHDVFKRHGVAHLLARGLLEGAHTMEFLSQHPHPNLIRYHGCRSLRGYITRTVLDHHSHTLKDFLKKGIETIDKKALMDALESAIHRLHSLGWAHNDLNDIFALEKLRTWLDNPTLEEGED